MKKKLFILAAVAYIVTISFLPTSPVSNPKKIAGDIPVIILPPFKVMETESTPVNINIKTVPKGTFKTV